jgi:ferric enterobactin receptor
VYRTFTATLGLLFASGVRFVPAQSATPPANQAPTPAPAVEIRGKIVDVRTNAPIPRASVTIRPKGATVVIAGAIADSGGAFRIQGLRPGAYSVRVTFIGFAPVLQEITIAPTSPIVDLGVAKLAPVAVTLDAISVMEERATVVAEPDRTAYRAKDIAPAAANAGELLENVPAVQVDVDGKVSLRGNENVVVQINGRPTPLRGPQLASFLKTLPANTVDRIEVMPNPSAKYDPDGMAGIINVALKQNVDLGLSGAGNAAVSTADRYNGSGNIGYQSGALTSFVSGGIVADLRNVAGINNRDRFNAANALLSSTDQSITSTPTNRGQNANATVDYKLSSRDVLSNALMLNHRSSGDASMTAYSELNGAGATLAQYARPRDTEASGWMVDYDVALKRTIAPRTHELSTEFRFNRAHDEDLAEFWRQPLATPSTPHLEGERDRNDAITKQLTGQVDYVRASTGRTKLETGWKSNARWLDREFLVTKDDMGTGAWVKSPTSNDFEFDEAVHAGYAVVSQGVGKFDLQAGLRGEYAKRTFSLSSPAARYPYDYGSVFPSAVALYNVDKMTQVKASYSRRIRRPGPQELNPFPSYFDIHNVFLGNPDLSPEYTDAYEFGLTKNMSKGMLQLSPFYRRTSNVIRVDINTTDTLESREVTSISFTNLATSNSWGSDIVGQFRFSPRLSGITNFSVFRMVTDGGSITSVGSDAVTWMGRINITSELTRTIIFQGAYNYRAPMNIEKGRFGAQQMANLSLRKKINGDKSSVTIRVNDPFRTGAFRVRAGDDKVIQLTERYPGARVAFVAYQYNFGRPPRVREVAPAASGGSVGFGPPGPP